MSRVMQKLELKSGVDCLKGLLNEALTVLWAKDCARRKVPGDCEGISIMFVDAQKMRIAISVSMAIMYMFSKAKHLSPCFLLRTLTSRLYRKRLVSARTDYDLRKERYDMEKLLKIRRITSLHLRLLAVLSTIAMAYITRPYLREQLKEAVFVAFKTARERNDHLE